MTDTDKPVPSQDDDDTVWPEHDDASPVDPIQKDKTDPAIEENTSVLGSPD